MSGTHKANLVGIPASRQFIEWQDMVFSRLKSDQIAEEWIVSGLAKKMLLTDQKNRPE